MLVYGLWEETGAPGEKQQSTHSFALVIVESWQQILFVDS